MRTVLISGAGVAGPALAFWLARRGFRPTVVERSAGLRSSGSPVDVRGPAVPVVERMGVWPALRAVTTRATGLAFVAPSGRRVGPLRLGRPGGDELEVSRSDLAAVLVDAARADAEFLFDETVVALHQDDGGVDVVLDREGARGSAAGGAGGVGRTRGSAAGGAGGVGRTQRFDLVVGADGVHSGIRGLVFGPEDRLVRPLGLRVATVPLGGPAADPDTVVVHGTPGRAACVHPGRDAGTVAFLFPGGALPRREHDRRETVLDAFAGAGHGAEVGDLLDRVRRAPDVYLDAVSEVRLPAWSYERTVLLGDAAASVSLFGDGSSAAIAGAYTLAEALAATPDDHARAFRAYEARHRPVADRGRRGYRTARALLVPGTRTGLAARNLAVRVLAGVTAPASRRGGDRRSVTPGTPA